ncbi:MAG: T9SS type A sorting domain-containing protein [Flavobacteriales bacterium]
MQRSILFCFIALLCNFAIHINAQQVRIDPFFNQGSGANGAVLSSVSIPGERAIIAGSFTAYNGYTANRIARLNPDGTFDPSFKVEAGFNGTVNKILLQKDGKLIAVGSFTSFNGQSAGHIIRLMPDGSRDASFNVGSGANGEVKDVVMLQDGSILAGGNFVFFNGQPALRLVKLKYDGTVQNSFQASANAVVNALHELPNGNIVLGGAFNLVNQQSRQHIAAIDASGQLLQAFSNVNPNGAIRKIKAFDHTNLWIAGNFSIWNGNPVEQLIKVNLQGQIANDFQLSSGLDGQIHDFIQINDSLMILGGAFQNLDTIAARGLLGLNMSGERDTNFTLQTNVDGVIWHLHQIQEESLYIAGNYTQISSISRRSFAKVSIEQGVALDFNPGFGISSTGNVTALARQADGKILVAGTFTTYHHKPVPRLFRLNVDGTLDTTFNIGINPNNNVLKILVQSDGKIVVVGEFTNFNGVPTNRIVRLNQDGSRDPEFIIGNGANNAIRAAVLESNGSIIIAGNFTSYAGTSRVRIARILSNGAVDSEFNPAGGFNNTVNDIALFSDGRIAAGGTFQNFNGIARNRVAIVNTDGSLDLNFDATVGANNTVQRVATQSDGRLLIAGSFTSYDGVQRLRFARINANGSLDQSFFPDASIPSGSAINAIQFLSDGSIMIAGSFASYNNLIANRIARINSNGSLAVQIYGSGADNTIQEVIPHEGGFILAGLFTSFNGFNRGGIARISSCILPEIDVTSPVCEGADIQVNAINAALNWQWNGPEGFSSNAQNTSISNSTLNNAGYYTLQTEPTVGCIQRSKFFIQIDTLFEISALPIVPVCEGEEITLSAAQEGIYQWVGPNNFDATGETVVITNAQLNNAGTYTLNSRRFACESQANVDVNIIAKPDLTLTVNSPVCFGSVANFSAPTGLSYFWTGPNGFISNEQNPSIIADDETQGVYALTVQNAQGCRNADSVLLEILEIPDASVTNNGPVCIGETALLAAFGGVAYAWTGPDNFNANTQTVVFQVVNNSQSGNYQVSVTGENGCSLELTTSLSIDDCLGIGNVKHHTNIKLFPNPASTYLMVQNLERNSLIQLMDVSGRILQTLQSQAPDMTIPLEGLAGGMYLLRCGNEVRPFQVVK